MTRDQVRKLVLGFVVGALSTSSALARDAVQQPRHDAKKPAHVQHPAKVKDCAQYGEGFAKIAGTNTCIKIGGYLRIEGGVNVGR